MLEYIEGGFYSGAHEQVKKEITELTNNKKRAVLIVPEQQTVMAEAEMARELPSDAPLYFEVTNFTRFANTAFRALGGIRQDYATSTKKALLMWQTLVELSPVLKMTRGRREITAGTVERALSAAKEAEALGLGIEELKNAGKLEGITERLRDKLSDLETIMLLYKKTLNERYSDTSDDIGMLLEKLADNPDYLCDIHIYFEGFTSFTAPQYSLIAALIERADVTITFNIPKAGRDAFEYTEVVKTRSRISALADKAGVAKKIKKLDGRVGVKSELLAEICPVIWKSNYKIVNESLQNVSDLRIFEAKTPFEECEFLASDIKRRVMMGSSYRDFAIVMANTDSYDGILDTGLDKAGIPHFSSYKTNLMDFEAVKLIFSALAAASGFAAKDVLAYSSCGLSGVTCDERDEFELYVTKWQITGKRFTDGVVWNMHPDGFDGKICEESEKALARIDTTRVKLIEPLAALSELISGQRSIRSHAEALLKFLEDIDLESSLVKRAKKLDELGYHASSEENLRLYSIIISSLDTLVEVLGDSVTDSTAFSNQLKVVFSSEEIGRIPAAFDEVMIGSADMLRLSDKRHVYMIGVNYGKFPAAPKNNAYFSDGDRVSLSSLGALDDVDQDESGARALYSFSRAFAYASDTVTLTYPRSDTSFSPLIPSYVITNIEKLTDGAVKPVKLEALSLTEKLYSAEIAAETLGEYDEKGRLTVRCALMESGAALPYSDTASIDNGALDFNGSGEESLYLTQTRIDTFVSCPLQYFCKFTLRLDEGERAEFGASGIGSYVHAILEYFFSEVKKKMLSCGDISPDERKKMTERAARRYLDGLKNEIGQSPARMKTALSRILRASYPIVDGLCEEFSKSGFSPAFFELEIKKGETDGPSPARITGIGGEKIYIYGTIDRVDTMQIDDDVYVRVVDYKTGSKDFHPEDIDGGKNLQMFLYLKSIIECEKPEFKKAIGLKNDGKIIPAGLIYVKTEIKDQRVNSPSDEAAAQAVRSAQKRMGMVLGEKDVYLSMGEEYIPIKLTKSGEVDSRTQQYLYSREDWNVISEKINDVVGRIGHRIASGDARSISGKDKKKKSPCEWCRFKAFCRSIKI